MPEIEAIAARHGVPPDAAQHVLDALVRGGGTSAQFSHPALGGMGQWHAPGSTMIGDMFNHDLKARVNALCADLAPLAIGRHTRETAPSAGDWWPGDLGRPSATGSQNEMRYALFPAARRLAVEADGHVTVYDTGEHSIEGVSQRQSTARDLAFTSASGPVQLHDLRVLDAPEPGPPGVRDPASLQAEPQAAPQASSGNPPGEPTVMPHGRVLDTLERLSDLHRKGVLTQAEFAAKKADLLARL